MDTSKANISIHGTLAKSGEYEKAHTYALKILNELETFYLNL